MEKWNYKINFKQTPVHEENPHLKFKRSAHKSTGRLRNVHLFISSSSSTFINLQFH